MNVNERYSHASFLHRDLMRPIMRPSDRPARKLVIREAPEAHVRELAALGELMLGAAWADGDKHAIEIIAIAEQLKEFVNDPSELPPYVLFCLENFDPKVFDYREACKALTLRNEAERMGVLTFLARVYGAERFLHPAEKRYLEQVAHAIGLPPTVLERLPLRKYP